MWHIFDFLSKPLDLCMCHYMLPQQPGLHPFTGSLTLIGWSLVCACVCVWVSDYLFVVVYTQLACVPTSGCVHIRVCVCYVFFWCAYVVAKWTSVNKLCADCIYLIHMLVDCTAVLRSCCVWEEKSLCSRSLVCGAGITAMSAWIWLLILTKSCAVMGSFFHYFFFYR